MSGHTFDLSLSEKYQINASLAKEMKFSLNIRFAHRNIEKNRQLQLQESCQ